MTKLLNPKSIAILGASRDEKKIGHIIFKNIVNSGFSGKIFPVNPNAGDLAGVKCYADYKDLPEAPELAVLAVPAKIAVNLLENIAKKGTRNVVILSSGFKETGVKGVELENDLRVLAEKHKLNILGPNCLGFLNVPGHLNVTFAQAGGMTGNLRFISQSGALAAGIFDWAAHHRLGFSEFITIGNKTVLNENDFLRYWLKQSNKSLPDPGLSKYRPVGLYLESISAGEEFLNLVSKISLTDPVFILKPGKSESAQTAMRSHTGSMAGDDAVADEAFREAGAIRCEGLEDMFDMARIFSWENAPRGPKIAIISNAGGLGVISADAIVKEGLQLANLSRKTLEKLHEKLPSVASALNPVDVLGDALADRYADAINSVLSEKEVDALVVILTPQVMTEIEATANVIGSLAEKYGKPVVCSFVGGDLIDIGEEVLNKFKIPSFRFPERAIKAVGRMWQWQMKVQSKKYEAKNKVRVALLPNNTVNKINQIVKSVKSESQEVLSILQADKILNLGGIKTPKNTVVKNLDEAQKFAQTCGWPVVLKISSPEMIHKTDASGVIVNIDNPEKLAAAWKKINQTAVKLSKKYFSVNVQQQIPPGVEVIVGIKYDESFGNILMLGAGGVLTELIADRNLNLLPTDERGAEKLLARSKVYPLLKGFRGQKPVAFKKLTELLVRLGRLAEAVPLFKEITINPVLVNQKGAVATDTRIILKS